MIKRRVILGTLLAAGTSIAMRRKSGAAQTLDTEPQARALIDAAKSQIGVTLRYDPGYYSLTYPGGDIPRIAGVCSDVVIRAYRDGLSTDLQKLVHEDMQHAFSSYPHEWGLKRPDANIDHRRVPNLRRFLARHGAERPVSHKGEDYRPGDLVTQRVGGNLPHIAIVSDILSDDGTTPLVIHNIGAGTRLEDTLCAFPITGHYRYFGPRRA